MKTSKGNRLHLAAALLAAIKGVKDLLIPMLILLVSQGFRGGTGFNWRLVIAAALVVSTAGWGLLQWSQFRYRVEDGQLKVDEGILIKKKQSIPLTRIQTVDFSEGLLHRMMGLVKVQVQTAGGKKPEAVFSAVTRAEANRLERELRCSPEAAPILPETEAVPPLTADSEPALPLGDSAIHPAQPVQTAESTQGPLTEQPAAGLPGGAPEITYKLPTGRLFLAGLTVGNLGVGISILFALLSQADDLFPSLKVYQMWSRFSGLRTILIFCSIVILLAWLLAVASAIIRFAEFTLIKRGGEVQITRGLLERSKVTLPTRRIQAVRVTQEFIWKPFGLVAVHVVCAGYGTQKGESTLLFPLMRLEEVEPFLCSICPEFSMDPAQLHLQHVPAKAKWGYLLPAPLFWSIVTAVVSFFTSWGLWGIPVVILSVLLGWRSFCRAAYAQNEELILVRNTWITETVVRMNRRKIQYATVKQNPLQRRSGLSTIKLSLAATLAGAHYGLKGLPLPEAEQLMKLSRRGA